MISRMQLEVIRKDILIIKEIKCKAKPSNHSSLQALSCRKSNLTSPGSIHSSNSSGCLQNNNSLEGMRSRLYGQRSYLRDTRSSQMGYRSRWSHKNSENRRCLCKDTGTHRGSSILRESSYKVQNNLEILVILPRILGN